MEKESLRVDGKGNLSHTRHPFLAQPNITRDFCENQVELITDVFDSPKGVIAHMQQLQSEVCRTLQNLKDGPEWIWPFSNPPYVKSEDDIPVAQFEGSVSGKTVYRNYLAQKYGKKKMLFSGIHLNYSFVSEMLEEGYRLLVKEGHNESGFQEFKNQIYLELSQKVVKYTWLIVYLTAASPDMDASFFDGTMGETVHTKYSSVRCSEEGYWNDFTPVFDYMNLNTYVQSIESYVRNGKLISASELYYPVRLKPRGENSIINLQERGVNHIELRMLDVNPLAPSGIFERDITFIHYLLLYLLCQPKEEFSVKEQEIAILNEKKAAYFSDAWIIEKDGRKRKVQDAALEILNAMQMFYQRFEDSDILSCIEYQRDKLIKPGMRYADRVRDMYGKDYVSFGMQLAKDRMQELM